MKKRILSLLLCLAMLLPTAGLLVTATAEESATPMAGFESEHIAGKVLQNDGTIGIPVELNTYVKDGDKSLTDADTPSIFYVIGTNTERIGTDSDEEILRDLLDEGYLVTVVDYRNHELAVSPSLDWSLQKLRLEAVGEGKYLGGASCHPVQNYILPAGYRIVRGLEYFDIAAETNEGVEDWIVKIWNEDFTDRCGEVEILDKNGNACKVKDIVAETIDDCVNKDGSPLDMKLRMDFIYPSDPKEEVPVMCLSSSASDRNGNWMTDIRPHMTGFLFNGYAGVTWDHVYVPMARYDHYDYFEDTQNYDAHTLQRFIGVKATTAAVRFVRYLSNKEHDIYKFDLDRFGAFGLSKAGYVYLLGNQHPEQFAELWDLAGDSDAVNGPQRWLTYEGGELDGREIPSNVQMVYAAVGNGEEWCSDGFAPVFTSQGEDDGDVSVLSFMERLRSNARVFDTPFMGFTMPDVGHTMIYGYSEKYQVDMYQALFDFANYYLQDANAICEYILPLEGTDEVETNARIELKFTGPISRTEIEEKVRVIDTVSGTDVTGAWSCELGRTSWYFTPTDMKGGTEHIVYVPADLKAENGKTIASAKSVRIGTVNECTVDASDCFSTSGDMTLVRTEAGASGVYIVMPNVNVGNSTSESLRFSVTNDAYNTVAVYAVTDYCESDPTASVRGEKLGSVQIGGKGEYRLDVSEYLRTLAEGARAVFYLEAEKTVGTSTVLTRDFTSSYDFRYKTYTSMSWDENHTEGGGGSAKTTYFSESMILFPYGLTEADYGRKFRITFYIKPTADRAVFARIRTTAHAQSTYMDTHDTTFTPLWDLKVGEWNKVTIDYEIDDHDYVNKGIQKVGLFITKSGAGLDEDRQTISTTDSIDTEWMYIDDITVEEIVTAVEISPSLTAAGCRPALVTHPSVATDKTPSGAFGVENGDRADTVSSELTVSGRMESERSSAYKKVYARLDLSGYDGSSDATVTLRVKNAKFGNLAVYGVKDATEAASWSADGVSWYSAPANDRTGVGVDLTKVVGGAPIDRIAVLGAGLYTVDVTAYAKAMHAAGGTVGTLIILSETRPGSTVISDEDFNDYIVDFDITRAGDAKEALISSAENYPDGAGYSYKHTSTRHYDRVKFDVAYIAKMTEADRGRRFRVTFQMKADKTGTFTTFIVEKKETGDRQVVEQTYTEAGVWQEFSYDFVIDDETVFRTTDPVTGAEIAGTYFALSFAKMGGDRPTNATSEVTCYIDNLYTVELSSDDISFEFTGGARAESVGYYIAGDSASFGYSYGEDFAAASGTYTGDALSFVSGKKPTAYSWAGNTQVTAETPMGLYTAFTGTDGGMGETVLFNKVISPAVGTSLSDLDLGRKIRFTVWLRSYAASRVFTFGVTDAAGTKKLGAEETYTATNNGFCKYIYTFTITSEMISAGGICVSLTLGAATPNGTDCAFNIDDISVCELDGLAYHRETTEDFSSYSRITTLEELTADGPTASVPLTHTGLSDCTVQPASWANHSGSTYAGMYTSKVKDSSAKIFLYNVVTPYFGDSLTEYDLGRRVTVSFRLRTKASGTFDLTVSNVTHAEESFAPIKTCGIDAAWTWQEYTYSFTVTAEMIEKNAALLTLRLNGFADYETDLTDTVLDDIRVVSASAVADRMLAISKEGFDRFASSGTVGAAWPSLNVDAALNETYGVVWAGSSSQTVNYITATWADHEKKSGGVGLQYYGNLTSSQIKFYNMITPVSGNELTEADIGRSFAFSFWLMGEQIGSFRVAVTAKSQNANTFTGKSEPYTVDAVSVWKRYTYEFTVTRAMVENKAALPTLFLDEGWDRSTVKCVYIDDLTCIELVRDAEEPRYTYAYDFENATAAEWTGENGPLHASSAVTFGGFESQTGAGCSLVTEEDGNKALLIHSNKVYNRVMLYNCVSPRYRKETTGLNASTLTEDDLGRRFIVSFRLKATRTGSFGVTVTAYKTGDTTYAERQTLTYDEAGTWQTYTVVLTVNRSMIEKNAGLLTLTFSDLGQSATSFTDIWLDDITSRELSPALSYRPAIDEAVTVSNTETDGSLGTDMTTAGEEKLFGIRKLYLTYADLNGKNANRAELVLRITEASGQILKIYGIPTVLAGDMTWNNAPANRYDEGIDAALVYGGAPVATLTASVGTHTVDATEYVRAMGGYATFVVTTESAGGKEYIHADFDTVRLVCDVDYTTDGTLTQNGSAALSGKSVTLNNVFGGAGAVALRGVEYLVRVRVAAETEKTFTLTVGTQTATLIAAEGVIELSYTATEAELASGVSSLTVAADSAGFTLCEVVVSDERSVSLESAVLRLYEAEIPTLQVKDFKVKSNITLASDLRYNLYVRVAPRLQLLLNEEAVSLAEAEIAELDGVLYYRVTYAFAAKDAADSVALAVTVTTAEGEKSADYVLSIPAYAKKIVGNDAYGEQTQTLMCDMLAYIDAAMTYFNMTSTEKHKAITDVIGENYALPDDADVGLVDTLPENSAEAKETIASVALLLKDTPAFVFYLKEGKEDLADSFSFTSAEGAPLKVEKRREDGRTCLVVTTYAYGMNDTLTFTYAGGSGSYNLAKYHSGTDASNTDLKTLTVRLAKYANSAKAYKAASESAQ